MKIGLISDTHGKLPEDVFNVFKKVDLILHAGDIGNFNILKRLKELAPVYAVYGNIDNYSVASRLPLKISFKLEEVQILMMHNIGNIRNFAWQIKRGDFHPIPDMVVFGHTHHPFYQKIGNTYFVNPGSASFPQNGLNASTMIIKLEKGKILKQELIKLKNYFHQT